MKVWIYSGAGNTFVILDGRKEDCGAFRTPEGVRELCRRFGTDGLMIFSDAEGLDFKMEYFNSDGSGGMMCGNGGRCISAFADMQAGVTPAREAVYRFLAPDGIHTAVITERDGNREIVSLRMTDVRNAERYPSIEGREGWFLNTGTRHFVTFVPDVEALDVEKIAPAIRHHPCFAPEGVNVNFVQATPEGIKIRTFEKGVEGETPACGTGITAAAVASFAAAYPAPTVSIKFGPVRSYHYSVRARRDELSVDFNTGTGGWLATDVHLTGPAELLAEHDI